MSDMRFLALAGLAVLASSPIYAANGTVSTSWGKADVSFDQYRKDSSDCGHVGGNMDVSNTEAATVFKRATRRLESNEAGLTILQGPAILDTVVTSARIVEGTRPQQRIRDTKNAMVSEVEKCLVSRGYVKFWLTRGQRARLDHLRIGSNARRIYLYHLATNPKVLDDQADPSASGR